MVQIFLKRNPPACSILDNGVFNYLTFFDDFVEKALRRFATCPSVNDRSCRKLFLSVPIMPDDNFRVENLTT